MRGRRAARQTQRPPVEAIARDAMIANVPTVAAHVVTVRNRTVMRLRLMPTGGSWVSNPDPSCRVGKRKRRLRRSVLKAGAMSSENIAIAVNSPRSVRLVLMVASLARVAAVPSAAVVLQRRG